MDDGGRSNLQPPFVRDYPPARDNLPPPFTDQGGTERVLGVSATKYTVDYYADGTSILMNFWVDSSGSLIRKILT